MGLCAELKDGHAGHIYYLLGQAHGCYACYLFKNYYIYY